MAFQMNAATRNARLDQFETTNLVTPSLEMRTGPPPASTATPGSGTVLVTMDLPADWMNNASGGQKAKAGTWSGVATATGTAGHFRMYNSQVTKDETTCFAQGTIGVGSGDMLIDNSSIVSGQTITIAQFTLTEGNP